jgi:hypothetical protein
VQKGQLRLFLSQDNGYHQNQQYHDRNSYMELSEFYMIKKSFFIVVLALFTPIALKGAPIKTIKTLATSAHQKGVQLL